MTLRYIYCDSIEIQNFCLFKTGFLRVVKHRALPASATRLLGLKVCATHACDADVYHCRNNLCIARFIIKKICSQLRCGVGSSFSTILRVVILLNVTKELCCFRMCDVPSGDKHGGSLRYYPFVPRSNCLKRMPR